MSQILDQITKSQLSKQGQTNSTGIFEGTPSNVAVVTNSSHPVVSSVIKPLVNPIDTIFQTVPPQQTYLDYLQASNK